MSISHAVMELIEEMSNATDNKKHAIGVFIDLKKGLRYIEPRTTYQTVDGSSPQQSEDTANNNSCFKQHTLSLTSAGAKDVLPPGLNIYPTFCFFKAHDRPTKTPGV